MDLVTSWRRRVLAASGAALIVPVAMLATAAALVGLGGGFGGLGSLDQLVSGPAGPPPGAEPGGRREREIARVADRVDIASRPAASGSGATSGGGTATGGGGAGTDGRPERRTSRPPASIRRPTNRRPTQTTPEPSQPTQQQPTQPAPGPTPTKGPLAPLGEVTKPITDALPQPLGQTVQGLVDGVTGIGAQP